MKKGNKGEICCSTQGKIHRTERLGLQNYTNSIEIVGVLGQITDHCTEDPQFVQKGNGQMEITE